MNNLNSILLEGNLTRDPDLVKTSKGKSICKFSIATNRYYKTQDVYKNEVSYFSIEVWAGLADICMQNLTKGRGVRIVGRLKQERWKGEDDKPRDRIIIVAEHVEFRALPKQQEQEADTLDTVMASIGMEKGLSIDEDQDTLVEIVSEKKKSLKNRRVEVEEAEINF